MQRPPWWVTIPFAIGCAILSPFAPTFFGESAQAALGLAAIALLVISAGAWAWHSRGRIPRWILMLVFVGSLAAGGLAASPMLKKISASDGPSVDDVSVTLSPDPTSNAVFSGRVIVKNKSPKPFRIDAIRIVTPSSVASGGPPINVSENQPKSFLFDAYFWRGGRVSFEAHYSVEGVPQEKAIFAEFQIPAQPAPGIEIAPTTCCEGNKSDFDALRGNDEVLMANGPEGCSPRTVTERRANGRWHRVWDAHARRILVFDPVERIVSMGSFMRGSWHWLTVPLPQTVDGVHELQYCWHEANGYMRVEADSNYAIYDADTQKIDRGILK